MVEKLSSSVRIQKITSSRIAFIGLAAATIMIAVSMIGAIQLHEASAAKPQYCYEDFNGSQLCYGSNKDCREDLVRDIASPNARCHPVKP